MCNNVTECMLRIHSQLHLVSKAKRDTESKKKFGYDSVDDSLRVVNTEQGRFSSTFISVFFLYFVFQCWLFWFAFALSARLDLSHSLCQGFLRWNSTVYSHTRAVVLVTQLNICICICQFEPLSEQLNNVTIRMYTIKWNSLDVFRNKKTLFDRFVFKQTNAHVPIPPPPCVLS